MADLVAVAVRRDDVVTPPGASRLYRRRRGRAHFVIDSLIGAAALCGAPAPWPDAWLGTGDQAEYDTAARRRLCRGCAQKAVWRWSATPGTLGSSES